MVKESDSTSWWHTLPGVLTAIAGLITAVAGLLAVLLQTGVLHRRGDPPPFVGRDSVQLVPSPRGSSGPVTVSATRSGAPRAWQDADAVLTGMDGTTTELRAPSFRYCISVGTSLTLNGSQEIYFEQMRGIDVLRSDPAGTPSGTAVVRITLVDGRTLEGRVDAVCGLFGYNDVGRYDVAIQSLRRIEFRR
jgi:hypothetical protein